MCLCIFSNKKAPKSVSRKCTECGNVSYAIYNELHSCAKCGKKLDETECVPLLIAKLPDGREVPIDRKAYELILRIIEKQEGLNYDIRTD